MILEVADDRADDPLRMLPEIRIEKVIILAGAVVSGDFRRRISRSIGIIERGGDPVMSHHNFWMLLVKPGRDGIRGCAENGFDARSVQAVEDALHPGKLKITIARLPCAPGRFAYPDHSDPRLLH